MEMLSGDAQTSDEAFDGIERELLQADLGEMIVTPREIDGLICDGAGIIASAINRALQPELSEEEIMALMN